ncbi:MAG: DUF1428 domain-containing protein [Patescibacteria group bacterium]|nr:MAG: DUF1428 domain-containing protein [Patescibacteria group bacterium]
MANYVDGYVLVAPKKNIKAYRAMASTGAKIWKKYGALEYFECVGDDLHPKGVSLPFPKMMRAKKNETIVFSFVVYKSRAHRDAVNKKVMKDPAMNSKNWEGKAMPFDMKRMAFGGFKTIVQA